LNDDQDLFVEDDWEKQPLNLSRSETFRIVQINLRNPNPREDFRPGSLRRHFYIDLVNRKFERDELWHEDRELYIHQGRDAKNGERPEDACGGRLVLVATSGSVKGNPAPAEAFSFVLVPRGEGKQRIFSVYSLGAAPRLRDDDEGQFALRPYDPQGIKNNLGTFF